MAFLFLPAEAAAQTTISDGCMQDLAGFNLNCTANDIQIANVTNLVINDDGCQFPGDTVDFTATYTLVTTAKERYDIGLYFASDGDPNGDGARSGTCSISTMPTAPDPPWLDLDGDACGDIDKPQHNPLHPTITLTGVACQDSDGDGFLNLPNCTSWQQTATGVCNGPLDAFPGSPSKCNCDIGFNVPIPVPPATLEVVKTANPSSLPEPGGPVTFSVTVRNTGLDPDNDVTLTALTDDIYGNITTTGHDGITATTCSLPPPLAAGATYSCSFTVLVAGDAVQTITDTVTADGIDEHDNAISGEDSATVTITDAQPSIEVQKTANPTEVLEPGGDVTFTVSVQNNSVATDPVTIDTLDDDIYGNLNGMGTCTVPQIIPSGATYTCTFTVFFTGNAGDSETDTVTAAGTDDENNPVSDSDSATVAVNDVPSTITLVKTANPTAVPEPGGLVTFNFTVQNISAVDTVTINSLIDSIYGDVTLLPPPPGGTPCALPQILVPGASYSCAFQAQVNGDAAITAGVTNTAMASGTDDDGNPVSAMDDATVNFSNVPPSATLTKTATMAVVTYEVVVTNTSPADSLTLTSLIDDQFGDITELSALISQTNCSAPQTLPIGGSYTCQFDGKVTSSPHTNEVTGLVTDNDGSLPVPARGSTTVTLN